MAAHAPKLVTAPSISQVARSDLAPKDRHRRPFTMGMWIASIDIQVDPPHAPLVIGYDTVDLDETATVLGAAEKLTLAILHSASNIHADTAKNHIRVRYQQRLELLDRYRDALLGNLRQHPQRLFGRPGWRSASASSRWHYTSSRPPATTDGPATRTAATRNQQPASHVNDTCPARSSTP
jgi:hypothetical protein